MTEERLISLVVRRLSAELDPIGQKELLDWASKDAANQRWLTKILAELPVEVELERYRSIDPSAAYQCWLEGMRAGHRAQVRRIGRWVVAASLLTATAIGAWLFRSHPAERVNIPVAGIIQKVLPGKNTARLTLSSGKEILLDSVARGELAMEGNARLVKPGDGSIQYQKDAGSTVPSPAGYNILTTPRSGQYQLTLADGSKVWLNNVSSLRFPAIFTGRERVVELRGEAYFEIAKDVERPFIVNVGKESVEVLGTSFNIMAYADEGGTQASLVTGAIRVRSGTAAVRLGPDEQGRVSSGGQLTVAKNVGAEDIASWRNGFFYFDRASFPAVMRQIARWYDIEVVYEGKAPEMEFGGKIDRGLTLDELLKYLDKNQLHFRLDGRKLIVLSR